MPAKKMVPTGILTAFGATGLTLLIFGGGLEGKSLFDTAYAYVALAICYYTTFICFFSLLKKNKEIEMHHNFIIIPSLWTNHNRLVYLKDIKDIDFHDGCATHVPPYMIIKLKQDFALGILSVRMKPEDYNQLCQYLNENVPSILLKQAA